LSQAGWLQPLQERAARFGDGGRIHQFLWQGSRPASTREKGTERQGTIRNRSEPSQVAQESFGLGRIAVTQRVSGCYCVSARTSDSGGLGNEVSQRKDAERRDKSERSNREGHGVSAGPVKTFRNACDSKNATAGLQMKGNLRVKRRDPWLRANALSKAAADPELSGEDADRKTQMCLCLVRRPVAPPSVQAS